MGEGTWNRGMNHTVERGKENVERKPEKQGKPGGGGGAGGGGTVVMDLGVDEFDVTVSEVVVRLLRVLLSLPWRLRCFVVFGSRIRGDWKPWSDTDVLIILETGKPLRWGRFWELDLPDWFYRLAGQASADERIFTPDQFERLLERGGLTALDALEEGVALYDDGYWRRMKTIFEKMKSRGRLVKMEDGWQINPESALEA